MELESRKENDCNDRNDSVDVNLSFFCFILHRLSKIAFSLSKYSLSLGALKASVFVPTWIWERLHVMHQLHVIHKQMIRVLVTEFVRLELQQISSVHSTYKLSC